MTTRGCAATCAAAAPRRASPRIGIDSSVGLGRYRWVVERTMSGLLTFRRLALRYDRIAETITALARLACSSASADSRHFCNHFLCSAP
jgi:transposase